MNRRQFLYGSTSLIAVGVTGVLMAREAIYEGHWEWDAAPANHWTWVIDWRWHGRPMSDFASYRARFDAMRDA